jgi:hypothetical protein
MDSYVLEETIYVYFRCLTRDAWVVQTIPTDSIPISSRLVPVLEGENVKLIHAFLMASAVVLSVGGSASANLIVNGDFSATASAFTGWPGYINWDAASANLGTGTNPTSISGWIHNGTGNTGVNGKDTLSDYPGPSLSPIVAFGPSVQQASPDRNWAFLQSGGAAIFQVINVTPGVEYTVSFDAAGRFGSPALGAAYAYNGTLGVDAAGVAGGFFDKSYSVVNFVPDSYTFTTTLPTATIVFQNAGGGDSVNFTNITVVPEPSTLAGLAIGAVVLGLVRRRT